MIHDDYASSDLSERHKTIVAYVDVVLDNSKAGMTEELRQRLGEEFTPEELTELALLTGMACGFSKSAIAWGPPPEMPVMEIPTPTN